LTRRNQNIRAIDTKNICAKLYLMRTITQEELDALVAELARKNTRPIIDMTLREIADEVAKIADGYTPSTSVVKSALERVNAQAKGHRWAWKHNAGKGE